MAKLQEKRNYVQIAANQVQNRLNEVQESKRKVEHDIKVAIYTLMNEINKKGKALLHQLEALTGERQSRLQAQHGEVMLLSRQVDHVMNFARWALTAHSNFALLYSKRLIFFQLRRVLRAPCDPTPALSGGVVRFYCDPNFWARNVLNLGTLVMENPVTGPGRDAPQSYMTNQSAGSMAPPSAEAGAGSGGGAQPGQINLAQLRLQHMQHRLSRLAASIRQPSSQHAPQRSLTSVHMVNQQPIILQYHSAQPPRLVTLPPTSRGPPCGPLPNPLQQLQQFSTGSIPGGSAPSHSSQQGVPPQLMRQHSVGGGGPGPPGGSHLSMGLSSIPSVTNPENLPTVPDIPPIQLDEFGGMLLMRDGPPPGHLSHGTTAAHLSSPGSSSQSPHPPPVQSPNLGASHLHGAVNSTSHMAPVRPSSASSNGSRASAMGDPLDHISIVKVEQVYVKQEPGTTASHGNACRHSSPPPPPPPPQQQQSQGSGRSRTAGGSTKTTSTTKVRIKPEGSTPSKRRSCMLGSRGSSLTPPTSNPGSAEGAGGVTSGSTGRGGTGGGGEANASADDDDPNEDWCGVCQNGGDLLCCERCPKVFHLSCHVPALLSFPTGEWLCAFCRSVGNPEMEYDSEDQQHGLDGKRKTLLPSPGLSGPDQRKCERLLLHLFCHELSAAFHEPVSHSVPSYYKTIRKPMDLSTIKLKLQKKHMDHYHTPAEFVSDVRLIFKNCAKFNEPDSEVGRAGLSVLSFFEETLSRLYPQLCVPTTPAGVFGADGPPTSSASSSALTTAAAAPPPSPPLPPSLLWLSSSPPPPLPLPPTPLRSASSSSSSPPRPSSVPSPNPASATSSSSVPTFAAVVPLGGGGPGGKKKGGRRKLNNNDDDYHDDGEIETSDEDFEPRRKKRAGRVDEKPVHIR